MARLLQRLGAFSVRRRRTVLASWLLALGVMAALSITFAARVNASSTLSKAAVTSAPPRRARWRRRGWTG